MQSLLAVYVFTYATLCLLLGRVSYSEPFVSLMFYGSLIPKINVKEYVLLGHSDVTVGCSTEDLPATETNGSIYLYQNDKAVEEVVIANGKLQLFWNGPTFSFNSYFFCEVYLTTDTFASNIRGSEVRLQQYSEHTDSRMCFPTANVFLLNEVVLLVCLSDRKSARWLSDGHNLLGADDTREISPAVYSLTNYIILNSELINADCQMSGLRNETLCSVELEPFQVGLRVEFIPDTFNGSTGFEQRYLCVSNFPTDRISWRIDSTNGSILDFDHRQESKINFSITHSFYSSQLIISKRFYLEKVLSVTCKTSRSGYVVTATAYNDKKVSGEDESYDNNICTQNPIDSINIITIIVIVLGTFSLICITVITVLAGLLRRQCNQSHGGSDVSVGYVTTVINEDPPAEAVPYYATSLENVTNESTKQSGYTNVKDLRTKDGLYYSTSLEDRVVS
ncbi:hypothetical protein HOLleu_38857 [Holothuria leucospilota]|uniref:Uncharacterized protein n=1 Tax=Holothuria leucospilota TaxID=206669 RepID=A0A9Q0YEZ6_HOLLE|nr:hypothetical protein HOLleu_38857 [Holothuria leucospilota]